MAIAAGTRIGPYEIVGWLGAGGMGEVYRARDSRLGREIALKLISQTFAADASRLHRFEQEARAAGQLNHPNILAVHDIGKHEGSPYIVSELLDGESLRGRLRASSLPMRKAVDFARQTAAGLAAAHDKGIIHRDVKPDNLFITSDGRIKILDFGIAKLTRPSDERSALTALPTATAEGMVVGTAGYMSPEQVRGEAVDARSDIFSLGSVLHEMLTGRPPFARETAAETMTAVLNEDPTDRLPASVPPTIARIASRCLEKSREMRFQSARDLAFAFEMSDTGAAGPTTSATPPRRWRTITGSAVVVLSLMTAAASWLIRDTAPLPVENPLAIAQFTRFTDWEGTETGAEISPDGKFVAFLADRAGQFDIWLSQVGTGDFQNLTLNTAPLRPLGKILRSFGFSGDGSEIWFSEAGDAGLPKMLLPMMGGAVRAFMGEGNNAPSWSPDGTRLVYFNNAPGDPMFVADRSGADPTQILAPDEKRVVHNHNPVWSLDGQWIYFVRGAEPTDDMDVWRIRPSGDSLERLTEQHTDVNYLAPISSRTLLYVAHAEDQSGPWLWALDIENKIARRVSSGLDQYASVAASRDGRRVVATIANPTSSLWTVPMLDRLAHEVDAKAYTVTTVRGLAPRFGATSLFYLSTRGTGDGLWRFKDGEAVEVWKGANGALFEPAAVSRDGLRVCVVVRQKGKRRLAIMSADGTKARTLTASLDILGEAGQGTADWSPDGGWIATGGRDAQGPGLFKIPVETGEPLRLVAGQVGNPVWSPDGKLIVYSGGFFNGQVELRGVRPDGNAVALPTLRVRPGGYRFLPDGTGLVYLPLLRSVDFWFYDLRTGKTRQLTQLDDQGLLGTFDVTPDGKQLVFDRTRPNSNIALIDLPSAKAA